jgi:hypothetical protein
LQREADGVGMFADLIDGPLAHIPSGRFGANSAWILCAAIAHNLLRAAGVLAGDQHTRAWGSTLRRRIVNVPARLARPQRRTILTCSPAGPGQNPGLHCGTTPLDTAHHWPRHPDHPPNRPDRSAQEERDKTSSYPAPAAQTMKIKQPTPISPWPIGGSRLSTGSGASALDRIAEGRPIKRAGYPSGGGLYRLARHVDGLDKGHQVLGGGWCILAHRAQRFRRLDQRGRVSEGLRPANCTAAPRSSRRPRVQCWRWAVAVTG